MKTKKTKNARGGHMETWRFPSRNNTPKQIKKHLIIQSIKIEPRPLNMRSNRQDCVKTCEGIKNDKNKKEWRGQDLYAIFRHAQICGMTGTMPPRTASSFVSKRHTSMAFAEPRSRDAPSINSIKVISPSPLSRNLRFCFKLRSKPCGKNTNPNVNKISTLLHNVSNICSILQPKISKRLSKSWYSSSSWPIQNFSFGDLVPHGARYLCMNSANAIKC